MKSYLPASIALAVAVAAAAQAAPHPSPAPGVAIVHRFALPKSLSVIGLGNASCHLTRVVYADGSHWLH